MKRIYLFSILVLICFSCKLEVKSDDVIINKYLYKQIPDKYNCGADENTEFNKLEEDGLVNNVYIKIDTRSDKTYIITSYIPKGIDEMPSETII